MRVIPFGSALTLLACGGGSGGSQSTSQDTLFCTADFEIYQQQAPDEPYDSSVINLNRQGIYIILNDLADLTGDMPGHGNSVTWQNVTTMSVGLADAVETDEYLCAPGFGCQWFDVTVWFASIPIAIGDNSVTIYSTDSLGYDQCQDVTVTHPSTHEPKSKSITLTTVDTSSQLGDPNLSAVRLSGNFEKGGLAGDVLYRHSRDSTMVGYTEYALGYTVTDQHNGILDGYFATLLPGSTYYFQAVITNSLGSDSSTILAYTTPVNDQTQAVPVITADPGPTSITSSGAYIQGSINGNEAVYSHFIEYSDSSEFTNYKETTRFTRNDLSSTPLSEGWILDSLKPETIYFYRLVAYNRGGTTVSDIYSFTTAAAN